jgi:hypothetical protein
VLIINYHHGDGGLPASRFFAEVLPSLDLPLNALYLTTALVVIFGCIFLGSSRLVLKIQVLPGYLPGFSLAGTYLTFAKNL